VKGPKLNGKTNRTNRNDEHRPGKRAAGNDNKQDRRRPTDHQQQREQFGERASRRDEGIDPAKRPGCPRSDSNDAHPDSCFAHHWPLSSG
jgi:hypothetical protein